MFYRLFFVLFSFFCASFFSHSMISETRVYKIIEKDTEVRFVRECSEDYFNKKLNSNKARDIEYCAEVCGKLLRDSIFNSIGKLDRIVAMINPENISQVMENEKVLVAFRNVNESDSFGEVPTKEEDLPRLELFASGVWSADDWILKCDSVIGASNNYELSSFDKKNYTLEKAIYILFAYMRPGFWTSQDKIFLCIKYLCGAMRTYLYFVEGVCVARPDFDWSKPSYFYILRQCYDFYSSGVKRA